MIEHEDVTPHHRDDLPQSAEMFRRLNWMQRKYDQHFQLFMHSDQYIQQRISQFIGVNTVLFGLWAFIVGAPYSEPDTTGSGRMMALFILSVLGIFSCRLWYGAYRRGALYRDVHRTTLERLDDALEQLCGLDFRRDLALRGAFAIRRHVLQPEFGQSMRDSTGRGCLITDRWTRKSRFASVAYLPVVLAVVWVGCLLYVAKVFVWSTVMTWIGPTQSVAGWSP